MPRARPLVLVLVAGLWFGACQSAPPAPELTNPRDILAAAILTTTAAKTVRIDGSADGSVGVGPVGFETSSAIELTGTTFSADLDLAGGGARATFSAPGLLGLTGELILVDGMSYLKTSLTGTRYHAQPVGTDVPEPSGASRATILQGLTDLLANPVLQPVKAEDVACGSATCYRVEIALAPADLAALGAGDLGVPDGLPIPVPLPDLTAAQVDLTVLVARETRHLAGLTATMDLGPGGTAAVDLTLSKWDETVSISAPPLDQIAPGT